MGPFGVESSALGGLNDTPRPVVTWHPESWVNDIYLRHDFATAAGHDSGIPASQVKLGQIAMPGTHDSAAYVTGDFAGPCNDFGTVQQIFGKGMTERWAKTQHHDLYEQAKLGVRSFDLRPYYDGSIIRTCHTLDTATLDQAIGGASGLNRFRKEQPLEPIILNLSHYKTVGAENGDEWGRGLDNFVDYLKNNVCGHAFPTKIKWSSSATTISKVVPAQIEIGDMSKLGRTYVVTADTDNGLYEYLVTHGLDNCVFKASASSQTAWASPDHRENVNGRAVSLNLWDALFRGYALGVSGSNEERAIGRGAAIETRAALQQFLIGHVKDPPNDRLHDSNYIWSYDTPNVGKVKDSYPWLPFIGDTNLGDVAVLAIKQKYDVGLVEMTDRTSVDWSSWVPPIGSGSVAVGLFDGGADFIKRLDDAARA
ncbi:MAG: hypothetical protein ABJC79_14950, partial [Acidimicrobiia bacterium]